MNSNYTHEKMSWKKDNTTLGFVDSAGGIVLYQMVNIVGVLWLDGAPREVGGGVDIVRAYSRR